MVRTRWIAALLLAAVYGAVVWVALPLRAEAQVGGPNPAAAPANASVDEQIERGRQLYAFHCTTCHGATGAGFAEARSVFPADHYDCSRCHGLNNPPQMSQAAIEATQSVFSLGDPPPVNNVAALRKYGGALGLFHYVRATMPRWSPGYVSVYEGSDDAYVDILAFVLALADLHPRSEPLTLEGLGAVHFD
jgi:hypothetical protein